MRTAIDANIVSALFSKESTASRAKTALTQALQNGGLVICGVVFVELRAYPGITPAFLDHFLTETDIIVDFAITEEVWRAAGEQFAAYAVRRRKSAKGQPKRFLADFLVGVHALHTADRLMTLDSSPYVLGFPQLHLTGLDG